MSSGTSPVLHCDWLHLHHVKWDQSYSSLWLAAAVSCRIGLILFLTVIDCSCALSDRTDPVLGYFVSPCWLLCGLWRLQLQPIRWNWSYSSLWLAAVAPCQLGPVVLFTILLACADCCVDHDGCSLSLVGAATSTIFVETKRIFCRDKSMLATTTKNWQNYVCRNKMFLSQQRFCRDKYLSLQTTPLLHSSMCVNDGTTPILRSLSHSS